MIPDTSAQSTSRLSRCFWGLADVDTPLALATVVQAIAPTSGKPGDKALVSAQGIVEGWIGGGCAQPAVIAAAGTVLCNGRAALIRIAPEGAWAAVEGIEEFASHCLSGGTLLLFIEPLIKPPRLSILGSSPVAYSLAKLSCELGFSVTMSGAEAAAQDLPDTIHYPVQSAAGDSHYCVIATQGQRDTAALHSALNSKAEYIALIASKKKAAAVKTALQASGVEADALNRIHSPAGIDIGAKTPAEIALSVLAELVRVRRRQTGDNHRQVPDTSAAATCSASGGCCGD